MKKSWVILRRYWRYALIGSLLILLNGWILICASEMYPVEIGNANDFWNALYHIQPKQRGFGESVYPVQGDTCVYYVQSIHERFVFCVPLADVNEEYVYYRIKALAKPELLFDEERNLLNRNADVRELVEARLKNRKEAMLASVAENGTAAEVAAARQYWDEDLQSFQKHWDRMEKYWINVGFEICFLSLLLFGVLAPFLLRKNSHLWRSLAAGLALPVLCTPFFLGYCSWTYTSVGPSGGAAYPWVLVWLYPLRWNWNAFDQAVLDGLGYPMAAFDQGFGGIMSYSGKGCISPTGALVDGVIVGVVVFLVSWGLARWRAKPIVAVQKSVPEVEEFAVPPGWDEQRQSAAPEKK